MKRSVLAASAVLAFTSVLADAAPARPAARERSPDILDTSQKSTRKLASATTSATGLVSATAAAALTDDDVGDADSFGKNVTYLGLAQTTSITLVDDCTGWNSADGVCVTQNPVPGITTFDETELATMSLPAKATKSLMCFALTPFLNVSWYNPTGLQQSARFSAYANITIDNDVLADPSLIDPNTGLPFNGSMTLSLSTWRVYKSIQPGAFEQVGSTQSRNCVGGVVSKRALVEDYGLTETQANQFFKKAMTLHFGTSGTLAMSNGTTYFYGIRLYGD